MAANIRLTIEMPAAETARQLLLVQLDEIQKQAQLVRDPDLLKSSDAVHDLRVAVRRGLTVLHDFGPWLAAGSIRKVDKGFRRVIKPLGRVRDLDVLALQASALAAGNPGWNGRPAGILAQIEADRSEKRRQLGKMLSGKDFRKWLHRQTNKLRLPDAALKMSLPGISGCGDGQLFRLADCLPLILYQAAAGVTVFHGVILDPAALPQAAAVLANQPGEGGLAELPADLLHRLRLAAKGFRYTVEAFQTLLDQPARQLIRDFKDFQDLLGEWHDAVAAIEYLQKYLKQSGTDEWAQDWLSDRQQKRAALQLIFQQRWPEMTAAWFQERLAACLEQALKKTVAME